jgi:hypothetical protein
MRNKFANRFKMLLEYNIKQGTSVDAASTGYVKTGLNEADPIPDAESEPVAPVGGGNELPAPTPTPVPEANPAVEPPVDVVEPEAETPTEEPLDTPNPEEGLADEAGAEDTEEDIMQKILKIHSNKLETFDGFIDLVADKLKAADEKVKDIEAIKLDLDDLRGKIKNLTPPTPLESGNMMIDISGGQKIEDYWNQWLAAHDRDESMSQNPYYPKEDAPVEAPKFTDTEIKDSLYK